MLASDFGDGKGWMDYEVYDYQLIFNNGNMTIEVSNGDSVLWHVYVEDGVYESGQFGFLSNSQQSVRYTANGYGDPTGAPSSSPTMTHTCLLGNYPNPFNPRTTIEYRLRNPASVRLSIYQIDGRKVATLINGFEEMGSHAVVWNGRDHNQREVSSGVYLYRLQVGDHVESKRMLLLR